VDHSGQVNVAGSDLSHNQVGIEVVKNASGFLSNSTDPSRKLQ